MSYARALGDAGHTSWSTTGLGYLGLWAAGKLRAFDAQRGGQPWRLVVPLLPLALAVYVGLTRIIDYWCAPCCAPHGTT
jgi:diacylglycerol diphosphate phosphatase / phosphatidate phosphatase